MLKRVCLQPNNEVDFHQLVNLLIYKSRDNMRCISVHISNAGAIAQYTNSRIRLPTHNIAPEQQTTMNRLKRSFARTIIIIDIK